MKNKRARTSVDKAVVDIWQREVGELSTRNFAHRLAASEDLVLRLEIYKKLEKHRGCVNTVSFNADGDTLVSGSDDKQVILWDWETGNAKLVFHSGHANNVFQAKIMPYTDDRCLVTCAADGQVRCAQILERGVETKLLAKHQGLVHKLAIEPGSSHIIYTCGQDGLVQHIDLRTAAPTELFACHAVGDSRGYNPVIQLNDIAIDPRNPNLFAVVGSDEYTRLYDIRKCKLDGSTVFGQPTEYFCPPHLIGEDQVEITGLAFSDQSELLVSYTAESIYLFTQDMGLGPNPVSSSPLTRSDASEMDLDHSVMSASSMEKADEKAIPQAYKGHRNCETVKGVSFFGPESNYVVSGSDCGRIFIWNKKGGELVRVMEADEHVVNCIESHPHTTVLASSGIEKDIKIWTPIAVEKATLPANLEPVQYPSFLHWVPLLGYDDDDDVDLLDLDVDDYSDDEVDEDEDDTDADADDIFDDIYGAYENDDDSNGNEVDDGVGDDDGRGDGGGGDDDSDCNVDGDNDDGDNDDDDDDDDDDGGGGGGDDDSDCNVDGDNDDDDDDSS